MSLLSTGDFAPRALSFNNRRVKKVLCTVFISGVFLIPQFVFALTLVEYRNPALLSQQEINIRWQLRDTNLTEVQRRALEDRYSAFPLTEAQRTELRQLIAAKNAEDDVLIALLLEKLADIEAQIRAARDPSLFGDVLCPALSYTLGAEGYRRDSNTGDQVSQLQRFLRRYPDIYPEGDVTGFYGRLTRKAVRNFQVHHGIINRADFDAGAGGNVGARTRKKIAALCEPGYNLKNPTPGQMLKVIDPNGGEEWRRRDDYTIKFENVGGLTGKARIFLMNVFRARQWIIAEVELKPGINEYTWFLGGGDIDNEEEQEQHTFLKAMNNPGPSEHDKIQVCALDYAICDESDAKFEIKARHAVVTIYGKVGTDDGPDIDADGMGGVLIGKNIQFIATTTSDSNSIRFYDVPFGTYTLSIAAPGYKPGVARHFRVNTYWAPRDPDLGNQHHREVSMGLTPTSYVIPWVTIKTPRAGEPLIISATTTIEWKGTGSRFKVELLNADKSQKWLLATTSTHMLNVQDNSTFTTEGDGSDSVTTTTGGVTPMEFKPRSIVWEVGKCYHNLPCNPPAPPGDYHIRVTDQDSGQEDGLSRGGVVTLYPPVGVPQINIRHDPISQIDTNGPDERIRVYAYYDPDGPALPADPVDISPFPNYYAWKSSNFDIVDRNLPDDKMFFVANGPGRASMRLRYRGTKAYVNVIVGGTREKPYILDISPSYDGYPPGIF